LNRVEGRSGALCELISQNYYQLPADGQKIVFLNQILKLLANFYLFLLGEMSQLLLPSRSSCKSLPAMGETFTSSQGYGSPILAMGFSGSKKSGNIWGEDVSRDRSVFACPDPLFITFSHDLPCLFL